MRIVVNHLTRMSGERICVAGVDLDAGGHVRPVCPGGLTRRMLTRNGGAFDLGMIVDLGDVMPVPHAPELEDARFDSATAKVVGQMPWPEFWQLLKSLAVSEPNEIFGPALERRGHTYATQAGRGAASLGCLRVRSELVPRLSYRYEKLRIALPAQEAEVTVTDLRCFPPDGTVRHKLIEDLNAGMRAGREVILAVGLANKYQVPGDTMERHWMQVNSVFPAGFYVRESECD